MEAVVALHPHNAEAIQAIVTTPSTRPYEELAVIALTYFGKYPEVRKAIDKEEPASLCRFFSTLAEQARRKELQSVQRIGRLFGLAPTPCSKIESALAVYLEHELSLQFSHA